MSYGCDLLTLTAVASNWDSSEKVSCPQWTAFHLERSIWWRVVTLAHAQIVHMLIVFCVHSLHPTVSSCSAWVHKAPAWLHWLLHVLLLACMQCGDASRFALGSCHHHQGISTLVLLINVACCHQCVCVEDRYTTQTILKPSRRFYKWLASFKNGLIWFAFTPARFKTD